MEFTHIANPVRVSAIRIEEVTDITNREPGCGQSAPDLMLRLADGNNYRADMSMTARYVPVAGDYLVIQEDGYHYLNQKDVFERKYRVIGAQMPTDQSKPAMSEQSDYELRREALKQAINHMSGPPENVVEGAEKFMAFLKGGAA